MRAARRRARTECVLRVYGSQDERATGRRDKRCKKRRKIKRGSIHREADGERLRETIDNGDRVDGA